MLQVTILEPVVTVQSVNLRARHPNAVGCHCVTRLPYHGWRAPNSMHAGRQTTSVMIAYNAPLTIKCLIWFAALDAVV